MDPDGRVALAEIRGDVKLILAGQDRTNADIREVRQKVHDHGNRIGSLEAAEHVRKGERIGVHASVKVVWGIAGSSGLIVAILTIAARHFGL